MSTLKDKLENKKRELVELEDKYSEMVHELSQTRIENEKTITDTENLSRKLEMKSSEIVRKKKHLEDLKTRLAKEISERDNFKDDSGKYLQVEAEYDDLSTLYNEVLAEIQDKETKLTTLEMRIMKLKNDISVATSKTEAVRTKSNKLEQDIEQLQRLTDDNVNQEVEEDPHQQRKDLDEALRTIDIQNDDILRKINMKKSQKTNLERSINNIRSQIEKINLERSQLEAELN